MFVAHHSGRTRLARRAFLLVGLLPAALLAGFGAWRHAPAHRRSVERSLEAALGVGLSAGRVVHPRPGVVRLEAVVARAGGEVVATIPRVELETSAGEVRLRASGVEASPRAASLAARLGRDWLGEPHRFGRNVVVECEGVWLAAGDGSGAGVDARFALRGECVAAGNGRAIRVRSLADGDDDALVVQAFGETEAEPARIEIQSALARPVALGLVAAILDRPGLVDRLGGGATVAGRCGLVVEGGALRGTIAGSLDGVDLAACTRTLPLAAEGRARVEVASATLSGGRLAAADATISGGPGAVDRATLDVLLGVVGARPGPAWGGAGAPRRVPYDALEARITLDVAGLRFGAASPQGLLAVGGRALLEPPLQPLPVDRLAWALSPGATRAVPATEASAWILSVLPLPPSTGALPADGPARR